jgi:NAD+ diphosphatase
MAATLAPRNDSSSLEAVTVPNTFAGAVLDRAAEKRTDEDWVAARLADPAGRALAVSAEGPYVDGERPALLPLARLGALEEPVLLGLDEAGPVFAVDAEDRPELVERLDGAVPIGLREAGAVASQADGGLLAYAAAIVGWHRTHRFCARCGAPTHMAEAGHVRRCPRCGAVHHPRLDPVVIVLVHDGDRVLLGRQPSWPPGRYSALAGFVEPGESLEEAVAREVGEESGVEVADIVYHSSQPWPFPASLMLGFGARHLAGEPATLDDELEDVRWFAREEVAAAARGEGPLLLPPPLAIARRLIDGWLA